MEPVDDTNREDMPEWDSLKNIEILFALEEAFEVEFAEEELTRLGSLNKIVHGMEKKHAT